MKRAIFKTRRTPVLQKQYFNNQELDVPDLFDLEPQRTILTKSKKTSQSWSEHDENKHMSKTPFATTRLNEVQASSESTKKSSSSRTNLLPQQSNSIMPLTELTKSPCLFSISSETPASYFASSSSSPANTIVTESHNKDIINNTNNYGSCPTCGRHLSSVGMPLPFFSNIDSIRHILKEIAKLLSKDKDSVYFLLRIISWATFTFVYPVTGLLLLVIFSGTIIKSRDT